MSEPTTTLNDKTANRTAAGPATQAAAPATPAVTPTAKDSAEGRKLIRNLVALLIVFGAVFLTLYVWSVLERHPRTDDAAARANVVGNCAARPRPDRQARCPGQPVGESKAICCSRSTRPITSRRWIKRNRRLQLWMSKSK